MFLDFLKLDVEFFCPTLIAAFVVMALPFRGRTSGDANLRRAALFTPVLLANVLWILYPFPANMHAGIAPFFLIMLLVNILVGGGVGYVIRYFVDMRTP